MITFNSIWSASVEKDDWPGVKSPTASYALSAVSRMAAMFFERDMEEIIYLMSHSLELPSKFASPKLILG